MKYRICKNGRGKYKIQKYIQFWCDVTEFNALMSIAYCSPVRGVKFFATKEDAEKYIAALKLKEEKDAWHCEGDY